jgi:hypothetical protein
MTNRNEIENAQMTNKFNYKVEMFERTQAESITEHQARVEKETTKLENVGYIVHYSRATETHTLVLLQKRKVVAKRSVPTKTKR